MFEKKILFYLFLKIVNSLLCTATIGYTERGGGEKLGIESGKRPSTS